MNNINLATVTRDSEYYPQERSYLYDIDVLRYNYIIKMMKIYLRKSHGLTAPMLANRSGTLRTYLIICRS